MLKYNKGFTLIELLAVIIILAVIALISTPVVLNVIENVKLKSIVNSCYGVMEGAKYKYTESLLTDATITSGSAVALILSGEKPITGTWIMDDSKIIIDNVSFKSMPGYVCTNKNTKNNEVVCSKGDAEIITIDAKDVSYTNIEYTECTNVDCALNELYNIEKISSINPDVINPETQPSIDSNYTMTSIVGVTDTEAPTCELYYVKAVSNGIQASFSCTDDSGVPILRSLFDSTTSKSAATFDNIGTFKNGSVSGNTKTVISIWNTNNTVSKPTPGICYYFRYGAQDSEGNFSTYVTNICYKGFSE